MKSKNTKEEIINNLTAKIYLNGDYIIAHTLYKLGEMVDGEFGGDCSPDSILERIEIEMNISLTEREERREEFRRSLK